MKNKFGRKRTLNDKNKAKFKPNRAYVQQATDYYLANGGIIRVMEADEESYALYITTGEQPSAVDEFLSGA